MATPLYTNRDGMKLTLRQFGNAWRDRLPLSEDTLPESLAQALRRLAAMEGRPACDPAAEASGPSAEPASGCSDQGPT